MRKKFKGRVFLANLSKPLVLHDKKVCSIKEVCGGIPLPKEKFYASSSACKACIAAKKKRNYEEKKKGNHLFI